jgi:hypothetical protein
MKETAMTDQPLDPPTEPFQPAAAEPPRPAAAGETYQSGPAMPFEPAPTEPVDPVPVQPVGSAQKRRQGGAAWLNAALGLALVVAVGGVAFAAGRMTAPAAAAGARALPGNGRTFTGNGYFPGGGPGDGQGGRGTFGGGGAAVEGKVTAVSADSITITTSSGQTIEVALNGTTTYHQQSSASASDVKTGGTVIVRLGLRAPGTGGTATGPTASDVTIVP